MHLPCRLHLMYSLNPHPLKIVTRYASVPWPTSFFSISANKSRKCNKCKSCIIKTAAKEGVRQRQRQSKREGKGGRETGSIMLWRGEDLFDGDIASKLLIAKRCARCA